MRKTPTTFFLFLLAAACALPAGLRAQLPDTVLTGLKSPSGVFSFMDGSSNTSIFVTETGTGNDDGQVVYAGDLFIDGTRFMSGLPSEFNPVNNETLGAWQTFVTAGNLYTLVGEGNDALSGTILVSAGLEQTPANATVLVDVSGYVLGQGYAQSNPFSFTRDPDNNWVIADAGANVILRYDPTMDTIGVLATLPAIPNPAPFGPPMIDAVPTSIINNPAGGYYVGQLTGFPFVTGLAKVWNLSATGELSVHAEGFTMITALDIDPMDGALTVLEYASFGPTGFRPNSARLLKIVDGAQEFVAGGFGPSAGFAFGTDGNAYATDLPDSLLLRFNRSDFGILPTGDSCAIAVAVDSLLGGALNVAQNSRLYDNSEATSTASDPDFGFDCFGEPDGTGSAPELNRTLWFTFTGDGNNYRIATDQCDAGADTYNNDTQIAIYSGSCGNLEAVVCAEDVSSEDFRALISIGTTPGTQYYVMVDGFGGDFASSGEFCLSVTNLGVGGEVPGDLCSAPVDLSLLFGQPANEPQTSTLFNNSFATIGEDDPALSIDCFGEPDGSGSAPALDRTLYYRFTGDGNRYSIETVSCNAVEYANDTQIAIFTGGCDNSTTVACAEDKSANDFAASLEFDTEMGVEYLMLVDGFGGNFPSQGEFCLEVTNLTPSSVTNVQQTNIAVFPNPTTGLVRLESVSAARVEVFGPLGRRILSFDRPGPNLDLGELPGGVYHLVIIDEVGARFSARVVKR